MGDGRPTKYLYGDARVMADPNAEAVNPWTDIRERLENAGKGSREIDEAIWSALNDGRSAREINEYGSITLHPVFHYTTSLDAIVAVVEAEGLEWEMEQREGIRGAWVALPGPDLDVYSAADTFPPALALCLAFARYMEAKDTP